MTAAILFEYPRAWWLALPLALLLGLGVWHQRRRGVGAGRIAGLGLLRLAVLLPLVTLAARPVWQTHEPPAAASRSVAVLLDRSESMGLEEPEGTRYRQAVQFLNRQLWPALRSARLPVQPYLFDQTLEAATAAKLAGLTPQGRRTDLGGAMVQAISGSAQPPLAIVALTDGIANENSANTRALAALVDAHVPFIGVGFGSDQGARTLSLRQVEAPASVSPRTSFSISAQLELVNSDSLPTFDLVLFRDGKVAQKKTVAAGKGSRLWLENFQLSESEEGVHQYVVQLVPPEVPNLKCVGPVASTVVRVSEQKELRVLYIQGALTWDYKFINRALHDDPALKLTGLTRTSDKSVFRQNVESAGELLNGFPTTIEELAPFRVIVLSNLRPADLTPAQQEMLSRFCGELGGGVLLMGGAGTFDSSWQNNRLEQLLPVIFSANPGVEGLDRPFHLQLTDEALANPVFQLTQNGPIREDWASLPTFSQYGRVDSLKPGAQAWMVHPTDDGPQGRRVLMASQRYGAGISAVLCLQNFWRWRLAGDADPARFDRFWRQLFRYLGDVGRQEVAIHLSDQDLHPDMDVKVVLEKQPNPKNLVDAGGKFLVRVENRQHQVLEDQSVQLEPSQPVDLNFHADKTDDYTVTVSDLTKAPVATRRIEIRDLDIEFQETARDMETLRQWAAVSDGLAFKAEDCPDAKGLVTQIKSKIEEVRRGKARRQVVGINGWTLSWVLGCLAGEWVLRKRWGLV